LGKLLFLLLFLQTGIFAQEISIYTDSVPLNKVLINLAQAHGVQLSFDDQLLSGYLVSVQKSFSSAEKAIAYLLHDLPLNYEKGGEVFIIYRIQPSPVRKSYRVSGQVIDNLSGESLPYSQMLINQKGIISDFNGNFSFTTRDDSLFSMRISYLGYYKLDTLLSPGSNQLIKLQPATIRLQEVVIKGRGIERSGQSGEEAGVIQLNHKIAYRLPGNGDNAIFNFLRLQPGILAAGERSSEMIIWGSYSGHNQILFDGFTVFGLKNFNDNISFVNPYLAKDIKVHKGGYSADYGDRVGGIVEISGINGSKIKPSINLNINNMTVNGMASVPLKGKSALSFAYRHTYYNLYDAEDLALNTRTNGRGNSGHVDINVYPDYLFRDFNLKFAGSSKSGNNYYLSLYEGRDRFAYRVDQVRKQKRIANDSEEENRQIGGSLFFGKAWKNGNRSEYSLSVSGLNRDLYDNQEVIRIANDEFISKREVFYTNKIFETYLKNKNYLVLTENHRLVTGWNYNYSTTLLNEDPAEISVEDKITDTHRFTSFIQDEISVIQNGTLTPGIRVDYPFHLGKIYIQPRIKASIDLSPSWIINGAWGIYNQFISETSVIDDLGNYRYFWAICDNLEVPVLQGQHLVGGATFRQDGFSLGLETFFKTTKGITRYVNLWRAGLQTVFQGQARVIGLDLLAKKNFGPHEAWASYTLSKTEEYFSYFPRYEYAYAPQDQRHEIKGAMLLNFSPIFFSVNYVYGSGFADRSSFFNPTIERYPYSRLDAAFIYRYSFKDYHFEAGISVMNLLNRENIKYSNFIRIPDSQSTSISVHAEAVPFTPTIYLNLAF